MCQTFLHPMWRDSQHHVLHNNSCAESLSHITLMCIYCGKSLRQRHNIWQLFTSCGIRARKHAHDVTNISVTYIFKYTKDTYILTPSYLLLMQQISFSNQKDILHNTKCCKTLVIKVAKHLVILVQRKETFNFKGPSFIDSIRYFLS